MTHRVHTILSLLAEDHAPAALRPSILLAVDWPTVAEEAPATGDDSYIACVAAGILGGKGHHSDPPPASVAQMATVAARLATVAASLTAPGDKAMTAHATALWGAAAALVGMPNTAAATANPAGWDGLINGIASLTHVLPFCSRADEMLDIVMRWHGAENALGALANKASNIIPGAKHTNLGDRATLIATALDRVHEYRNSGAAEAFDRGVKIRAALGIMPGDDILRALAILRETLSAHNSIGIMSAASMRVEDLGLARQGRDRALAECAALREQLLGALGLETSLRTTAQLVAEVIDQRDTARIERDRALTENRGARDILHVPAGNDLWSYVEAAHRAVAERDEARRLLDDVRRRLDSAREDIDMLAGRSAAIATERDNLRASLTVMEAEVSRCNATIASTAAAYSESRIMLDKIAALVGCDQTREGVVARVREAVAGNTGTLAKPRPQPGDAVPWAEVEDGALYWREWSEMFCMVVGGRPSMMTGPDDDDIERSLASTISKSADPENYADTLVLVARDLGPDHEAWRAAMREWTANGNKPASESSRPR